MQLIINYSASNGISIIRKTAVIAYIKGVNGLTYTLAAPLADANRLHRGTVVVLSARSPLV
ncbi:hypothetical protein E2C01_066956 [Portunus trituberculatus]|uniref:Uncharacterized protein n=1 Tax=Portunus trituberculatus TaxID=210409 RepID=A0A5B7HW68_PORTR|nr:hypothetical protein [Portunus trituberculatus]